MITRNAIVTLPQQVALNLEAQIRSGELHQGRQIRPRYFAELLGVSPRTVSRALTLLKRRKLVSIRPDRGAYVLLGEPFSGTIPTDKNDDAPEAGPRHSSTVSVRR